MCVGELVLEYENKWDFRYATSDRVREALKEAHTIFPEFDLYEDENHPGICERRKESNNRIIYPFPILTLKFPEKTVLKTFHALTAKTFEKDLSIQKSWDEYDVAAACYFCRTYSSGEKLEFLKQFLTDFHKEFTL